MVRVVVALVASLAVVVNVAPAEAVFPGGNGALLVAAGGACSGGPPVIVGQAADDVCPYRMLLFAPGGRALVPWLDAHAWSPGTFTADGTWLFLNHGSRIYDCGTAWCPTLGGGLYVASVRRGARPMPLHRRGYSPAGSADGRWIAYQRGKGVKGPPGPPGGVYVAPAAGGPPRYVADGSHPRWSSRGRLAFTGNDGGVMVTDEHARHPRFLRRPSGILVFQDWAPNGRELVVSRGGELYAVRVDSRGFRKLTSSDLTAFDSTVWSPDGRTVAFLARIGENGPALFTISAHSRAPQAMRQWTLLLDNVDELFDWQPLP